MTLIILLINLQLQKYEILILTKNVDSEKGPNL